jgi:hypothetical protein
LFFRRDPLSLRHALAFCARCPVRGACAAEARAVEAPKRRYGVRAGLTAEQRKRRWD